jgi:pyruvate dehydrogenase E1 component alpha subunit
MTEGGVFEQIEKTVRAEVEAGVRFALNAPYPDPKEVDQHVYA